MWVARKEISEQSFAQPACMVIFARRVLFLNTMLTQTFKGAGIGTAPCRTGLRQRQRLMLA